MQYFKPSDIFLILNHIFSTVQKMQLDPLEIGIANITPPPSPHKYIYKKYFHLSLCLPFTSKLDIKKILSEKIPTMDL